jgi:hypothetical protein
MFFRVFAAIPAFFSGEPNWSSVHVCYETGGAPQYMRCRARSMLVCKVNNRRTGPSWRRTVMEFVSSHIKSEISKRRRELPNFRKRRGTTRNFCRGTNIRVEQIRNNVGALP